MVFWTAGGVIFNDDLALFLFRELTPGWWMIPARSGGGGEGGGGRVDGSFFVGEAARFGNGNRGRGQRDFRGNGVEVYDVAEAQSN